MDFLLLFWSVSVVENRGKRYALRSSVIGLAAVSLLLITSGTYCFPAVLWSPASYNRKIDEKTTAEICSLIGQAALRYEIPKTVFTRLVWEESHFDLEAHILDGAPGLAGIDPRLMDEAQSPSSHDAGRVIPKAAAHLAELQSRFGNIGWAVAAYKLGEDRFAAWMASGDGTLPTRADNFVFEVTGVDPKEFLYAHHPLSLMEGRSAAVPCGSLPAFEEEKQARIEHEKRWAAIVAGNFRRSSVQRYWTGFASLHQSETGEFHPSIDRWVTPLGRAGVYTAKIYSGTREDASHICDRLHKLGGPCIVLRD